MKCLAACCVVLLAYAATAQYEVTQFRHYTTRDGLSNSYVTGIVQDSLGYIWISTQRGLNRFDGFSFRTFLETTEHKPIPDNTIASERLLNSNQISIATTDGGELISASTLRTTLLNVPTDNALRYWSNSMRDVLQDKRGNYGVSTKTGFYIFSSSGELKNRYDYYSVKDIGHTWMLFGRQLHLLPNGNLLQENSAGLLEYDAATNAFREGSKQYPGLRAICADLVKFKYKFFFVSATDIIVINNRNNLFELINVETNERLSVPANINLVEEIGWQTQLSKVNDSTWVMNSRKSGFYILHLDPIKRIVRCDGKKYLDKYFCSTLFCDKDQRLWVGTNDGLLMQDLKQQEIVSFPLALDNEKEDHVTRLFIAGDKIFVATGSQSIYVLNKYTRKIVRKVVFSPPVIDYSCPMLLIHPDTLLVGTFNGLKWLNTRNFKSGTVAAPKRVITDTTQIRSLFEDSRRNIWMSTNEINTLIRFNTTERRYDIINDSNNSRLKINSIFTLAEDADGNVWIAGDAVARWNSQLNKIDTLIEEIPRQRNRKKGFAVLNDSRRNIWFVLNDNGVAKFVHADSVMQIENEYVMTDPTSIVKPAMIHDKIFIRSSQGIGMLNTATARSILYSDADGIPETPITSRHFVYDSSDNSVWFASNQTLYEIREFEHSQFGQTPVLQLNQVSVNDSLVSLPASALILDHNQNDLRISLGAVNFIDPENMRFAYRFKNEKDSSWTEIGTQQVILLSNISPGKYDLQFRLRAFDNKWPDQLRELRLSILPPFWKTSWFIACAIILFSCSLFGAYLLRIRYIKRRTSIDKHLAELEMKALHAQMNPHFIFNALNSIQDMVLQDDKKNASRYLSRFAQLIRLNLEHSKRTFITLRENIEYLQYYLNMEQMRFEDLQFTIVTDPSINVNEACLPPMLIQPLVENAIWHGLLLKQGEKKLQIRFRQKSDVLICEIEDNGIGLKAASHQKNLSGHIHHSVGITNINQRIEVLNQKYKIHYQLNINDKEDMPQSADSGTIAVLKLPLHEVFS